MTTAAALILLKISVDSAAPGSSAAATAASAQSALIGFSAVLVGAVVTALFSRSRERSERRAAQQVQALYDLQEAAFGLREAYRSYNPGGLDESEMRRQIDLTFSRVDTQRVRVFQDPPRLRLDEWIAAAQERFVAGGPFDPEDRSWVALNRAIGKALRNW